jgi:osmotically-inducible protein OsmY
MHRLFTAHSQSETWQTKVKELADRRLCNNKHLCLKTISSEYLDGVLVLRGSIPTYYLKQVAQEAVSGLEGVRRVDNQIRVRSASVP